MLMSHRAPDWEAQWTTLMDHARKGAGGARVQLRSLREQFEALIILRAWQEQEFNITRTANALGISRARVRRTVHAWRNTEAES